MKVNGSIFTKLVLAREVFVKNTFTEFHENQTNGFAADTRSQTDGRMDGGTDGRMDGWKDEWMDGRTNGWTEGRMD